MQGFDGLVVVHADGANLREYGRQAGIVIEARLVDLNDFQRSAENTGDDKSGAVFFSCNKHHVRQIRVLFFVQPERNVVRFVSVVRLLVFVTFHK